MSSYKYVMQDNNFDCGIASLMTCFMNMGKPINKEHILDNIKYTNGGISAYDLISASNKLGVPSRGVKCNIDLLTNDDLPCIAHIIKDKSMYHYITILNENKKNLEIFDPANGIETISKEAFNKLSTGVYILFNKLIVNKEKDYRFKKFLIDYILENSNSIGKTIVISLFLSIVTIVSNYYLKTIMESLQKNNLLSIVFVFAIFLNIYMFKNIMLFLKNKSLLYLNNKTDKKITKIVTNHLFHLPYKFFAKRTSGELSTIVNDIENFKEIVNKIIITLTIDVLLSTIISLYIAVFNIYFFLLSNLLILLLLIVSHKYQNLLNDSFIKLKVNKISYVSTLIESLSNYNTVKNLMLEDKTVIKTNKEYKKVINSFSNYNNIMQNYYLTSNILSDLYYIIVMLLSVILCFYNKIKITDIVLFSGLFNMIIANYTSISNTIALYKMYKSSVSKIMDILDIPEELFKPSKLEKINNIKLLNVSPIINDKTLTKDITFEIKKSDKVFIEGKSGVGKSSLMKLLLNYNNERKGQILIDNIDIKYLSNKFIRSNIIYVSQNETLYNDTLYNNMKIVCDSKKKIERALKTCLVNEMFNDQKIDYNYLILSEGQNLSGGERKKIIIARSLLKAKSVLILDEAFNELGVDKEKQILENIFNNYKELSVILISHRKNNKNMFNKVLTMKGA